VRVSKSKSFSNFTAEGSCNHVSALAASEHYISILLKPSSAGERSTDMIAVIMKVNEEAENAVASETGEFGETLFTAQDRGARLF
jgi:hypothetical protein